VLGAAEAIAIEPRWGQVPAWCALEQARCAVLDGSVTRDLVRYPEVIETWWRAPSSAHGDRW